MVWAYCLCTCPSLLTLPHCGAELASHFHSLSLVACFLNSIFFHFLGFVGCDLKNKKFSHAKKLCCLQTSESWAVTGSSSFPPQVPHASKCAHLLDESMMWRRIPDRVDLPTAARLPMAFLLPQSSRARSVRF